MEKNFKFFSSTEYLLKGNFNFSAFKEATGCAKMRSIRPPAEVTGILLIGQHNELVSHILAKRSSYPYHKFEIQKLMNF